VCPRPPTSSLRMNSGSAITLAVERVPTSSVPEQENSISGTSFVACRAAAIDFSILAEEVAMISPYDLVLTMLATPASASILLLVANNQSLRLLSEEEAARCHGGQVASVCAKSVVTTVHGCPGSTATEMGFVYKCDGTELDQDCTAATYNSGNVCDIGSAFCTGPQRKSLDNGQTWQFDQMQCTKITYITARLQQGKCVPAPPPPP